MKKEIKVFLAILLVTLNIIGIFLLILPTKAESTTISVSWTKIYLTQSWDSNDDSKFYIQVKYKNNNGWQVISSSKHKCENIEPGDTYNPGIVFTIEYIDIDQYIYIRMMEYDSLSYDDQVCKDGELNTGKSIDQGTWEIPIYLPAFFSSRSVGETATANQYGDYFVATVTNLG